ncbi:MAG: hypothetical protein IJ048_06020 [Clostridia bacterium]|nr:hypothetical protein [Clostridia bacterium]
MDNFHEEVASKYNKTPSNILYALCWVAIVLFGILAMMGLSSLMSLQFSVPAVVYFVLFGGLAVLIWFKKDNLRVEYDYTFTNGDLDVGKVFGNARRRLMTSLNMKNVEMAGMVTHQSFQRFMNDNTVKKHNWFVNREANLSYFYFQKENAKTHQNLKHVIVLELSDEMLAMLKPYLKFGVWQGENAQAGPRF